MSLSEMATAVPNFCSMKSVILAKWTLLTRSIKASLSETSSSLRSTALKCCSCRLVMSTRWSTRLLFEAICVSSVEILAELNVDKVSAVVDMPRATRSRNHLSRVFTSYLGRALRMSIKLFTLFSKQARLISATSSTCV